MDRIYFVLNEIRKGTTSAKVLFTNAESFFKGNLVDFQIFLNDLESEVYIRFLGGNSSPTYGDIILTDKGRDYLNKLTPRYGLKDFSGPCLYNGKMKCKEHFITDINDLCNTCFLRTKIASVRSTMIQKIEAVKSINSKEYFTNHLNKEIEADNKIIEKMINMESTAGAPLRENRVCLFLSYKDCIQYYYEQLKIIESENTKVPISMEIIKSDTDKVKSVPDVEFIQGTITESFQTHVNPGNNIVEHSFVITRNGEKRKYTPYKYLDLILECYFIAIDKEEDINLKISAVVNAKVTINRRIREHGLSRFNYDFSNIFAEIEDTMFQLKSYKELGIVSQKQNNIKVEPNHKKESNLITVPFDYSNGDNYFFTDKIDAFKRIESELLIKEYIDAKGNWNKEKRYLVAFIHIMYNLKYLRPKINNKSERTTRLEYRRFFEKRYKTDITQEMKPKRFPPNKLKEYIFDFHFIPEIEKM